MSEAYDRMIDVRGVIHDHIKDALHGLFFSRNTTGDRMCTIYADGEITVDICYEYGYFEVFGLTPDEEEQLKKYYKAINPKYHFFSY